MNLLARPPRQTTLRSAGVTIARRARTLPGSPGFLTAVAAVFFLVLTALGARQEGQQQPAQPETPAQEKQQEQQAAPAAPVQKTYVGSDTCMPCHEEIHTAFAKNPHQVVEAGKQRKKWANQACESCHGPGSVHAETVDAADILQPAKLKPAAANQICLSCHLNQKTNTGRMQGGHGRNEVACTSCHSVHGAQQGWVDRRPLAVNKQCASCHQSIWAQFLKPHTHPLQQNAMSCTGCHNPHGSVLPAMTRTVHANEPNCIRCHGDKRGPFVFEHAPMRLDGCGTCHEVHGSANPRMLTRQEQRFVCMECHSNIGVRNNTVGGIPPSFHDLRSPRYQNCTICHIKIHGSHINRDFLR
jgi:DmsE family decaheme c-type cytochrome